MVSSVLVTRKYRARRKLLGLLKRSEIDDLAKVVGQERPWHSSRGYLEARLQEGWSSILPEIEEVLKKVVEDSKDDPADVQSG